MRVKLCIANRGFPMSKVIEMPFPPVVGIVLRSISGGPDHAVTLVAYNVDAGLYDVDLHEDVYDEQAYGSPSSHLAHLDVMKESGWTIANENLQRESLQRKVGEKRS
jgi:hypothetical protein